MKTVVNCLYCATCGEELAVSPLDADAVVVVIHAMAGHRLVLSKKVMECGDGNPPPRKLVANEW